jgi:hypothetical protein
MRVPVSDATILIRDMAGDAATNAATKVRPSEDKLNQIDQPAEDNTWHDAPDFSKENVRAQLQSVYKRAPTDEAKDAANTTVEGARQPDGSLDPQAGAQTAMGVAQDKVQAHTSDEDREAAKNAAAEYRRRVREYLNKKMPQERRDQTVWRLKVSLATCYSMQGNEKTNRSVPENDS